MLAGRLAVGALSSLAAGAAFAWIAKGAGAAATALGIVLLAVFLPVHFGLWEKFPVWYQPRVPRVAASARAAGSLGWRRRAQLRTISRLRRSVVSGRGQKNRGYTRV
jgi:hypothetical protein